MEATRRLLWIINDLLLYKSILHLIFFLQYIVTILFLSVVTLPFYRLLSGTSSVNSQSFHDIRTPHTKLSIEVSFFNALIQLHESFWLDSKVKFSWGCNIYLIVKAKPFLQKISEKWVKNRLLKIFCWKYFGKSSLSARRLEEYKVNW